MSKKSDCPVCAARMPCALCSGSFPSSKESEYAVLSCMMAAPSVITIAVELLQRTDFALPACAMLFDLLIARSASGAPVDAVALLRDPFCAAFFKRIDDSVSWLGDISVACYDPAQIRHWCEQVSHLSRRRRWAALASEIAEAAHGTGAAAGWTTETEWRDGMSEIVRRAEILLAKKEDSGVRNYAEVIGDVIDTFGMDGPVDRDPPVSTGISGLDDAMEGGIRREYIIVSGKSGEGKSLLAYQMAGHLANAGRPGLAVGLEMTNIQVCLRDIAREAQVPLSEVMGKRSIDIANIPRMRAAMDRLQRTWRVVLMDKPRTPWSLVVSRARDLHRRGLLDWMLIDYMGLLDVQRSQGQRKDEVLVDLSYDMFNLGKELGITTIAPVQVNEDGLIADAKGILRPCEVLIRLEMEENGDGKLAILKQRFGEKNKRVPVFREGQFQTFVYRETLSGPDADKTRYHPRMSRPKP